MSLRIIEGERRGFLVGFFMTLLLIVGCGTDAVGTLIGVDPVPHTPESGAPAPTTPTAS